MDRDTIVIDHDGEPHFRTLPIEEYSSIESLQSSFSPIFHTPSILNDQFTHSSMNIHDRISIVAKMTQSQSNDILKLINVFRQISEFNALHDDDRFILIKYNLFSLYLLRKCLAFNPINQRFFETSDDLNIACRFFSISPGSEEKSVYFIQWINSMCQVTEQDKTLVQLLLVVLLFSKGISMIDDEPFLHDSIAVNRAQIHYTHLIWNLFMNKWGYERAVNHFIQLLNLIFRLQTMTKLFRSFLQDQMAKPDTIDHIAPLMQTVLHISETN